MRVVVVGAGIAGLAAAWRMRDAASVTVVEAGDRVGGKLRTDEVGGLELESGADAFLARDPEPRSLCAEVGVEVVAPATLGAQIWWEGALHPLPSGVVLGVPTRIRPLLTSTLMTARGALRAASDLFLPRRVDLASASVGALVRLRLGTEVAERLADPLLSGVYAGDIDRLGAASATPLLAEAARTRRSLIRGVRAQVPADRDPDAPVFLTVRDGLGELARRLAEPLDVRTSSRALSVRAGEGGYEVAVRGPSGDDVIAADAVVVALPAYAAADVLGDLVPLAVEPLRAIPYASVALATLVYPGGTRLPAGSGILVPRRAGRLVKAATWVTQKWPERAGDGDAVVVRASAGRAGEEVDLDDDAFVATVRTDLAEIAGVRAEPDAVRVTRWPRSLPQYEVGHADRLRAIDLALAGHPRIVLAGAAYGGVGIGSCIRSGESAAARILG